MPKRKRKAAKTPAVINDYDVVLGDITGLLEQSRRASARSVNAIMTLTYWQVGRKIVESEQHGKGRAEYGKELLKRLAVDLTDRFGRGFSERNLQLMRRFYWEWEIPQTLSAKLARDTSDQNSQTLSAKLTPPTEKASKSEKDQTVSGILQQAPSLFPLPWSQYVRLLSVKNKEARTFYEVEAIRGGWSIRQLNRQIESRFYERTGLSKNKSAMLSKGQKPKAGDLVTPEEELKDPYILEFLDLKDEYSESDLEEALINTLEEFLLELGGDFAFVGRQRRLRIDDEWYRVDLLFFHRRLKCLVVIDLKLGKFTHADAGQMNLYLNYAAEHWTHADENPPVGLILCASKGEMLAKYALKGLPNKVLAREYQMTLPDENVIASELQQARRLIEERSTNS